MPHQGNFDFDQLEIGFEFTATRFQLEPAQVAKYVEAVEETAPLFTESPLVPPSALAAYAQTALLEHMELVPGTIHASQELEFLGEVRVGEGVTSQAKVSRKQERGKMRILNIDIDVSGSNGNLVMKGKNSFILPSD